MNYTFEIGSWILVIYIFAHEHTASKKIKLRKMVNCQTRTKLHSSQVRQQNIWQMKKEQNTKRNSIFWQQHIKKNSSIIKKQRGAEWGYWTCSTLKPEQQELEGHVYRWQCWISYSSEAWTSGGEKTADQPADKRNHDVNVKYWHLHIRENVKIIKKWLCEKNLNLEASVDSRASHGCVWIQTPSLPADTSEAFAEAIQTKRRKDLNVEPPPCGTAKLKHQRQGGYN